MTKERIFKPPQARKIAKTSSIFIGKYLTQNPIVLNLNLNVTNLCNQNCPMCNSVIVGKGTGNTLGFDEYRRYLEILEPYKIPSLTISGGEPSIVKDIPEILDYSANKFPFGVNCNTNLYANEHTISRVATAALRNGIRIGTSFDGFGEIADKLRGVKNVSERVMQNIKLVTKLRKELKSNSILNIHTVISDQNIDQVPDMLAVSERYGWTHTLAPVNNFFYQDSTHPDVPVLHYSKNLERVIKLALTKEHVSVSRQFLSSIPSFTKGKTEKLCPYLTGIFKSFKVFLDPNGDLSLCSRKPIGNIKESSIKEMLNDQRYEKELEDYRRCPGCWMACFVEILLATPRIYQRRIKNIF
ncbi:MAG: radical SAM protein [Spirochaetota bacterium]|nr:radical SAM protein [Spirochaetota bacterium]